MLASQIRKSDKYERESVFMTDNAADFPKNSPGDLTAKKFAEVIAQIRTLAAAQSSRQVSRNLEIKDEAMTNLIKLCQQINRAANALGEEIEGIENLFRMPRKRSESVWLATARAFYQDSERYETPMQEYIKQSSFRNALQTAIDAVSAAMTAADSAGEQKGGATGGLTAAFTEAGMLSRRLNAILLNRYDDDAQKMAAWAIASHVEAAPQRSSPTDDNKK